LDQRRDLQTRVEMTEGLEQSPGVATLREQPLETADGKERISKREQVAMTCDQLSHTGRLPLDVANGPPLLGEASPQDLVVDERRTHVQPLLQRRQVNERTDQTATQETRAHRRPRSIEHVQQAAVSPSAPLALQK